MAPFSINGQSDISVDISPNSDGAIRKVIVLPGVMENNKPLYKDHVEVEYSGFFETGQCFTEKQKYCFCIGTGDMIQAWNICVTTMCLGEVSLFHCTSDYCYGVIGLPSLIPPSTNLIFEIELISFKGEDLTKNKDEGILMSIISSGTNNEKPLYGATCKVNIVGWCSEDKEFLNFVDYELVLDDFTDDKIIRPLERAIKKSSIGQKSLIKIIPKYGYKFDSSICCYFIKGENFHANSVQYFLLTLLSIKQSKQHWEMTQPELLESAKLIKEKGSDFFKIEKCEEACHMYKRSLFLLESIHNSDNDMIQKHRDELKLLCHLNLAYCHLTLGNYLRAFNEADIALQLQPDNIKALYRRGLAHLNLSNYDEAMEDLLSVLKIEPRNKDAHFQLKECRKKISEDKATRKNIFSGMFNKFKEFDQRQTTPSETNGDVFCKIGEWNNEMAQGMLSLEQEMEAFKFEDEDEDIINVSQNDDDDYEQFCL